MKKLSLVWTLFAAASWLLASCGTLIPTKIPTSFDITFTDKGFSPAAVTVQQGGMITLNLKNTGASPHDWTVMSTAVSGALAPADSTHIFFSSNPVAPGTSFTDIFQVTLKPGVYQVISMQSGDIAAGLVGTLTVK